MRSLSRRDFLSSGLVAIGAIIAGPGMWQRALAVPRVGDGPYGALRPPDANGLMLPEGFSARVVARSGRMVPGTDYIWHTAPDGGATFPTEDKGWIYVSNSEANDGGVGVLRFDEDGKIVDAYPVLRGSARNCAGGPTPWGTWLSCEEVDAGRVWECDPMGKQRAEPLPALGIFQHEAAAVDPRHEQIYLTEDQPDGGFYRFTPASYPALDKGLLEIAQVGADGATKWHEVPDPSAARGATRNQVPAATPFDGGEGTWFDDGVVYFTTKGDNRVWSYDTVAERMSLLYDADALEAPPLTGVDNVTVSALSGDVFVAEDGGDLDIVFITPDDTIARLVKVTGDAHQGSEVTGPALDPAGKRMYFSSQRGFGGGITYEVRGPFRVTRTKRPPAREAQPSPAPLPVRERGSDSSVVPGVAAAGAAAAAAGAAAVAVRRRRRSG